MASGKSFAARQRHSKANNFSACISALITTGGQQSRPRQSCRVCLHKFCNCFKGLTTNVRVFLWSEQHHDVLCCKLVQIRLQPARMPVGFQSHQTPFRQCISEQHVQIRKTCRWEGLYCKINVLQGRPVLDCQVLHI